MSKRKAKKITEVSQNEILILDKATIDKENEKIELNELNSVYEEFCKTFINENFNKYEITELEKVYSSGNELLMQYYISTEEDNMTILNSDIIMQLQYILSIVIYSISDKKMEESINRAHEMELSVEVTDRLSKHIGDQFEELNNKQNEIADRFSKIKEEMGNLVYNILGFIASFSIVSAAVVAIINIKSISGILLFMAYSVFLLLTTLIGLHNFYKNDNKPKNILQNNYALWKMMIVVIVLLVIYRGVTYVKENQDFIFESIGRGIGQVQNIKEEN